MPLGKDTSVLYYNPLPNVRWSQRKYLLYPVRMYRVVAPRVSSHKVNILEKAVLGMCRAGITEAAKLSVLLVLFNGGPIANTVKSILLQFRRKYLRHYGNKIHGSFRKEDIINYFVHLNQKNRWILIIVSHN